MISKSAREDQDLADIWASRFRRWGVAGLASFAAEIIHPFGFLGAQALHMFAPVVTAFFPPAEVDRLARLLESPEALDRLSDSLSPSDPEER